jgi:PPOX class probable F420-dependent enzyme
VEAEGMDEREAWERLRAAPVGRLATCGPDGPHVVPFVFALHTTTLYWAVDEKPKRSTELKRLANIRGNPKVEVLVDEYRENWRTLWWVRADGTARILEPGEEWDRAISRLAGKYHQYRDIPPQGPVVAIDVDRVTGWEAGAGGEAGTSSA